MNMQSRKASTLAKLLMSLPLIAALLFFTGVPCAHAESEKACQHHVAKADHELHDAIAHHGPNSPQAEHKRHDLEQARERCWKEHHKWWDEDQHRWHDQQDWDDHGHDHN